MIKNSNRSHAIINLSPTLLLIVLSFSAGISWATSFPIDHFIAWLAISLLSTAAIIVHLSHHSLKRVPPVLFLVPLFFFIAALYTQPHLKTPADPNHIYNLILERQTVSLDGILQEMPSVKDSTYGYKTNLLMHVRFLRFASDTEKQNNKIIKATGLIQLNLKGILPEDLMPGDRFIAKAVVSRITTYSTPGTFNYKKFLAHRSIWVNGWIESSVNIVELHDSTPLSTISGLSRLRYVPERIRTSIAVFLDNHLSQPSRGLYKAILIGDRSSVEPVVLENFTRAGCIHILAISGMHMGLISLLVIGVLTWLLKRSAWLILHVPVIKIAAGLALLPLLTYAFIAGFNTPVVRALIMTVVFVLALLFNRPGSLPTHILLAALIILIWKPTALHSASFQLSFSAVIAIAVIYPRLYHYLFADRDQSSVTGSPLSPSPNQFLNTRQIVLMVSTASRKWLCAGLAVTTAAMLGILPIAIFHFNRFSLVSPVTNLLVEPLVCLWSLVLGIIACIFIPFAPWAAESLFQVGSWGLLGAARICAFFSSLPFASLWLSTPTIIEIFFYYLFLASLLFYLYQQRPQQLFWRKLSVACFLCLLVSAGYPKFIRFLNPNTTVTFLDVGHGSAVLLQLPRNKNILIDGGGARSDRFNIGERIIAPFLWKNKISRLEGLVITHPHADHYNGLPFILNRFRPKVLWINGDRGTDYSYLQLLDQAEQLGIETRVPASDMLLFENGTAQLRNIRMTDVAGNKSPMRNALLPDTEYNNPNNRSLVLRLDTAVFSYLFPGDINRHMEKKLISEAHWLKADVLLSPHHGSSSSNSPEFLSHVDPSYLVISAGRHKRFQFPDYSLPASREATGIQVYTTAKDGTVTFSGNGRDVSVSRYQVN